MSDPLVAVRPRCYGRSGLGQAAERVARVGTWRETTLRRTITSGVRGSHARGVSVFVMVVVLGSLVGAVSPAAADATCSNLPINGVWLGSWQGTAGTQALGGVVKNEYTFTGADVTSQIDLISGETALGPGAPTTVSWDSADATSCTYSFSGAVTGSGTFNATGPNAGLITGTWNYQSLASGTWLLGPATVSATGTGTAVTDNGNPPSAGTPIETAVTSPSGGTITIDESQTPGGSFPGYSLLNSFVRIDAPTTNTAGMPLLLTFDLDGSVTSGETAASVAVIRDGTAIPDCADTSGLHHQILACPAVSASETGSCNSRCSPLRPACGRSVCRPSVPARDQPSTSPTPACEKGTAARRTHGSS